MFRKILVLTVLFFPLQACFNSKSNATTLAVSEFKTIENSLNTPKNIIFLDNEFIAKNYTSDLVEYYLKDEEGYHWTSLVTVMFYADVNNLDVVLQAMRHEYQQANKVGKKVLYEINKLNDQKGIVRSIYYPIKNDNRFNSFELYFAKYQIQDCGLVILSFSKRATPKSDPEKVIKFSDEYASAIINSLPQINCK